MGRTVTEEDPIEIERENHVRALEEEITRLHQHVVTSAAALINAGIAIAEKYAQTAEQRVSIRRAIGDVVDVIVFGLYPQAGEERDE